MKNKFTHIFFVGIGGIGMSALARYFNNRGQVVFGYDKTPSPLTRKLEEEGISVTFKDLLIELPSVYLESTERVLVVFTPAISKSNTILNHFRNKGFTLKKRAEVLGLITQETKNLSVAGTHGKTTTSSMVATILQQSNWHFSAFLGGISTNLESNYYYQKKEGDQFSVTEADEFDRSFLHLKPNYTIITSTDADHLDIYGAKEQLEESYKQFANLVPNNGNVFYAKNKARNIKGKSYSATDYTADYYARITSETSRGTEFDVLDNHSNIVASNLYLNIPGLHNLENAVGATVMSLKAGLSLKSIRDGLAKFLGIKRRFEFIVNKKNFVFIDDYAHHPSELSAIISSVRNLYPQKKITAVFQPHLFSRTRDFMEDFAVELSKADELILLPIYPAREEPIEGITSNALLASVVMQDRVCVQKKDLLQELKSRNIEVLLTLGAGDIDRLVEPIKVEYGNKS